MMFFDVDLHVLSVGLCRIDPPVKSSLGQEDFDGGNSTADAGDAKHCREEYCKQVPQDIDEKAESDEQQPYDEESGREVSGGLRNRVCVEPKAHIFFQVLSTKS